VQHKCYFCYPTAPAPANKKEIQFFENNMRSILLSPTNKSPRGVADVFLQGDSTEVKEKLKSSFSWADDSASSLPLSSPTKKKATSKKVRILSDKDDTVVKKVRKIKKEKKATGVTPTTSSVTTTKVNATAAGKNLRLTKKERLMLDNDPKIQFLREAIEIAKKEIEKVNEQRKKDKENVQDMLIKAKKECRERLESVYMPVISTLKKDGKSKDQKHAETAKVIQYLKDDNAKIRKEIDMYARKIKDLNQSNASLERHNHHAEEAIKEVAERVEEMKAVNEKLTENEAIFKDMYKKMKKDYIVRTRHHQVEVVSSRYYETCIKKVVKSAMDRSKNPTFIESICEMAAEGTAEAIDLRDKNSPNAELEDLPLSKKIGSGKKASWSFMFKDSDSNGGLSDSDSEYSDDED
jgi:myosin heavy subunit